MKKTALELINELNPIQQKALYALEQLHKSQKEADKLNRMIDRLTGDGKDFHQHNITPILSPIENKIVDLLDEILDSEIASYWLYECDIMRGCGLITLNGKDYKISNFESVVRYVHATRISFILK